MYDSLNILDTKILVNARLVEGCIAIRGGKIIKVGKRASMPKASKCVDGRGLVAVAGLIDAHVHLRDMQLSDKEDFYTGTCAAAVGGFTTVLDMPNTLPPTDSALRLKEKQETARSKVVVNVGFHALPPRHVEDVREIADCGAFSFKLYMNQGSFEEFQSEKMLASLLEMLGSAGNLITVHAEDIAQIERSRRLLAQREEGTSQAFLKIHSPQAELSAVEKITKASAQAGARIHVCHVTLPQSVRMLERVRRAGLSVSIEATPHHLLLDESKVAKLSGFAIMVPPLRKKSYIAGLRKELGARMIDIVASDHAPHTIAEKKNPDFSKIPAGIPGLETTLPLLLTCVKRGYFSLSTVVQALTANPARIFGIPNKGVITEGADADITLIDLKARSRIKPERFLSKAKYSPFAGFECTGKAARTFVMGKLVMDHGEIVAEKGSGSIIGAKTGRSS